MDIKIVKDSISREELEAIAQWLSGDYVKVVIDVETGMAAFGGELHADEEAELLRQNSKQENLWGINLFPQEPRNKWIAFDSMINIRPSQGNRSRSVESQEIREKIKKIIDKLVRD